MNACIKRQFRKSLNSDDKNITNEDIIKIVKEHIEFEDYFYLDEIKGIEIIIPDLDIIDTPYIEFDSYTKYDNVIDVLFIIKNKFNYKGYYGTEHAKNYLSGFEKFDLCIDNKQFLVFYEILH